MRSACVSLAQADAHAHAEAAHHAHDAGTTAFRRLRCGWLHDGDETGKATFPANTEYFDVDVIHPTG